MKKLVVLFSVAFSSLLACGPKPKPAEIPVLPGDGDKNVAKPTDTGGGKTQANDPWVGRTDLIVPPAPKAPAKLELPGIDEFKLANGLQVFVVKNARLPVVSVQLAIKAGRMDEPRARLGVAEATADMLVKGTTKRNAVALAKAIDFVGGTIAADSTFEATLVSCSVLARNLPTCLELMPEMITQSTFPDDELKKVKEGMVATVRNRLDDAGLLASVHVQNLLWGNEHVRGWVNSEASINALRRDDLVAWQKTWFQPNNSLLVIAGDLDAKKVKSDLERAFGGWKKGTVPPTPSYKEPGLSGTRIRLVDKPGQTQTHIRIAQFGIKHDDPRFFDSLVWNYALGGGAFSSRLMKVVRVEGGKTYGASSNFDRNLDKGSFVASTFTRNSEAVATTKLMLGEIAKMAKDGPTQAEVDSAIANIAGGYGLRFQSAGDVGSALVGAELHGFGIEYLSNFPLVVGKVDVESAKRAANEILDPKNYVVVMVGDAKDLEPQLEKAGWRYEKTTFAEPITKEPKQPEAPVDAKSLAAAKQILAEAVAAKGGKAKLAALKSLRMVATGTTKIQGQELPVEIERVFVVPDKMRIDATLAKQFKVIVGVDGKSGWQQAPTQSGGSQTVDFKGKDIEQAQFEAWREPELLLLKATDKDAKVAPAKDDTIDGKPHAAVRVGSPFGPDLVLYIDKKTKLISRVTFSDGDAVQTDDFSDYKDVGGIKVAHKRASTGQGRVTNLEVTKVEWDPKIDPAIFKKPAK
ncbi:MAG TPA: insulinase family protein [Kofleriaceae bacterium]|nr:insulinase family protein [Kofleriaceae bacterium]